MIYITGDIHAAYERLLPDTLAKQNIVMQPEDVLIVAGDFGIPWVRTCMTKLLGSRRLGPKFLESSVLGTRPAGQTWIESQDLNVITHTCSTYWKHLAGLALHGESCPVSTRLDYLELKLHYKKWFFGFKFHIQLSEILPYPIAILMMKKT